MYSILNYYINIIQFYLILYKYNYNSYVQRIVTLVTPIFAGLILGFRL